ncbi:hypothetical protein SAMN02949497_4402 [Methylomagnum ishizawai]|uniref:Uncharacterized protein n=1 Tax=Methylomagnum ishizawai TaxID=1760988 RepID=A0A1Y6D2V4_9GAMM|nr:hypothetical protein SAMN02949497_4402 [Methylomagnum ishizawai]
MCACLKAGFLRPAPDASEARIGCRAGNWAVKLRIAAAHFQVGAGGLAYPVFANHFRPFEIAVSVMQVPWPAPWCCPRKGNQRPQARPVVPSVPSPEKQREPPEAAPIKAVPSVPLVPSRKSKIQPRSKNTQAGSRADGVRGWKVKMGRYRILPFQGTKGTFIGFSGKAGFLAQHQGTGPSCASVRAMTKAEYPALAVGLLLGTDTKPVPAVQVPPVVPWVPSPEKWREPPEAAPIKAVPLVPPVPSRKSKIQRTRTATITDIVHGWPWSI